MPFEGWAILEIMGHRTLAGYLREVDMFGVKMAQIDVPDLPAVPAKRDRWLVAQPAVPAFTQLYGGAAIFSTTPTTEAVARETAERLRQRPMIQLSPPMLEASPSSADDAGDEQGDEPAPHPDDEAA